MMVLILYGMIALYFVGVILLVIVIAVSHSSQPKQKSRYQAQQGQGRILTYGICAALFVLLSLLAVVAEREHFQTGIKQS